MKCTIPGASNMAKKKGQIKKTPSVKKAKKVSARKAKPKERLIA